MATLPLYGQKNFKNFCFYFIFSHQYYEKELELKSRNGVRNDRNISEPYKKSFMAYVTNVTRFVFNSSGIEWTEEIEAAFNESAQNLLEFHVTLFEVIFMIFTKKKKKKIVSLYCNSLKIIHNFI